MRMFSTQLYNVYVKLHLLVSKWKYNRSLIMRGFSSAILKSYFKVFLEKDIKLVEMLNSELNSNKSFDIFDYISKITMDAVCGNKI